MFIRNSFKVKSNVEVAHFSIEGPKGRNDDRILLPVEHQGVLIAAIADGVGGSVGGGLAADVALRTLADAADKEFSFMEVFRRACGEMELESKAEPELKQMATTISAISIKGDKARVGHVGDTRIYHFRDNGVVTRTLDQTEVAELLRQKVLTPDQAKKYPRRNVLLSYLSPESQFDLFEDEFEIKSGDVIMLLTDGIYNEVRKLELAAMLKNSETIVEFAGALEAALVLRGARDDSSMIAFRID